LIIFDFDQTLVDTSPVEHLRAERRWKDVMARLSGLEVYPGIDELLNDLHASGKLLAIVTKSPSMVPKWFIDRQGWPVDVLIGYHDVKFRKPHPEGILTALAKGKSAAADSYHVGDQVQDTEAARAAEVAAIGVTWGIKNDADLIASKPDEVFKTVAELRGYFGI
jgi:phosphoglycolate phosphatase-like HAD superfamily hydrolase